MYRSIGVAAMAFLLSATGCSSDAEPLALPAGALPPGTIDISINGQSAGRQHGLACTQIQSVTMATAGEGDSAVRAVVKGGDELAAVSVQLTDLDGFTGSYMSNLQGRADAKLVGTSTFEVSGEADGFFLDRPAEPTTSDFVVRFAC